MIWLLQALQGLGVIVGLLFGYLIWMYGTNTLWGYVLIAVPLLVAFQCRRWERRLTRPKPLKAPKPVTPRQTPPFEPPAAPVVAQKPQERRYAPIPTAGACEATPEPPQPALTPRMVAFLSRGDRAIHLPPEPWAEAVSPLASSAEVSFAASEGGLPRRPAPPPSPPAPSDANPEQPANDEPSQRQE